MRANVSFLIFVALVCISYVSKAQEVFRLQLYFESNSFTLGKENENKIDSLITKLTNLPEAYQLEIVGHADSLGSSSLNDAISGKRATETKRYLLSKGFREEAFDTEGRGFTDPITDNQSEATQAKNRRVTVTFRLDPPPVNHIGGITLDVKKFHLDADVGGVFHHESGSSVDVPGRIFVDDKGEPIKGEIDFTYTEFRDPIDFILSGLPMEHKKNNQLFYFNSSGMFRLTATQKGKPVRIRSGASIRVDYAVNYGSRHTTTLRHTGGGGGGGGKWEDIYEKSSYTSDYENWRMHCGGCSGGSPPPCPMSSCQQLYMMLRVGSQYAGAGSIHNAWRAQDSNKVMELFEAVDSCFALQSRYQKQTDSVQAIIKKEIHSYRMVERKRSRRKSTFTILCQGRGRTIETGPLNNLIWKYRRREDTMAFRLIKGSKWTDCTVSRNGERFTIELANELNAITLNNVKLKLREKIPDDEKETYLLTKMLEYDTKRLPYQGRISELRSQLNEFSTSLSTQRVLCEEMNQLRRAYGPIYYELQGHSIYCFFLHNYKYMNEEEKKLRFIKWLNYFDQHRSEMYERYQKILNSAELGNCRQIEQESLNPDPPSRQIVSVDVKALGSYNITDLVQIPDTMEVRAEFRNEKKQPIWPVLVFLTDKTFNGVVRYDGRNRYGPYKFRISPSTVKAVIAFDTKGQAWLCSGTNLPPMLGLGKNARLSFSMKLIKNPTSREELLKEL